MTNGKNSNIVQGNWSIIAMVISGKPAPVMIVKKEMTESSNVPKCSPPKATAALGDAPINSSRSSRTKTMIHAQKQMAQTIKKTTLVNSRKVAQTAAKTRRTIFQQKSSAKRQNGENRKFCCLCAE
mmetsp:Transcript_29654/g.52081  ORF Transcript_29654/g.52081 Transcript_29654/m.52081 type:complete len:126 (-) Transcript_29654:398-775(-)